MPVTAMPLSVIPLAELEVEVMHVLQYTLFHLEHLQHVEHPEPMEPQRQSARIPIGPCGVTLTT